MQREKLGSRLGFILLSAGCAIGIGNVWKFPWLVGQNGGAIFVLIYLFFLIVMGVPIMTMEFSVGRASGRSPAGMYKALTPEKKGWNLHSVACIAGNIIIMMFYTTVTGWMLQYFVKTASGELLGLDGVAIERTFSAMNENPIGLTVYTYIVIIACFAVISVGLQKGLERITKYMMLALLGIMVFLALYNFTLDGGISGLKFYLLPNIENVKEVGITKVIVSAMNQSFFTLSIGMGSMAIFGSYIDKDRALMGEAVNVAVLDTFVALTAGLIIFPACFSFGIQPDAGPDLIFITLPNVFNKMGPLTGRIAGSFFFMFLSFAALSTVLTVFEAIVACVSEITGFSRRKTCAICCVGMLVLALPCILGFNVLSHVHTIGANKNIMDLEDFIVSNCILPLGSVCFVVYCTTSKYGWGWDKFIAEANTGKGLKFPKWLYRYCKYVLPLIIFFLFAFGIYDTFFAA